MASEDHVLPRHRDLGFLTDRKRTTASDTYLVALVDQETGECRWDHRLEADATVWPSARENPAIHFNVEGWALRVESFR